MRITFGPHLLQELCCASNKHLMLTFHRVYQRSINSYHKEFYFYHLYHLYKLIFFFKVETFLYPQVIHLIYLMKNRLKVLKYFHIAMKIHVFLLEEYCQNFRGLQIEVGPIALENALSFNQQSGYQVPNFGGLTTYLIRLYNICSC